MDPLNGYRRHICDILSEYARVSHGDELRVETVFDTNQDRYLVVVLGREAGRRLHHCLIHIEILDGKIWVIIYLTHSPSSGKA